MVGLSETFSKNYKIIRDYVKHHASTPVKSGIEQCTNNTPYNPNCIVKTIKQQQKTLTEFEIQSVIQKYQNAAGNLPKRYNTFMREIRAVGDTTDTKQYNYRTDYRKTYPNGSVIMQSSTLSGMDNYYDPRRPKPSFLTRLMYLFPKAAPKYVLENWDELERNHRNDIPALDKTRRIGQ